MPRKPNYRFERAERNRAKDLKKQEKLLRRQENAARRESGTEEPPVTGDEPQSDPT
jgi:hypothetical protein